MATLKDIARTLDLSITQVSRALKVALKGRQTGQMLVHHSDRGIQYCSNDDQEIHRRHGIACSIPETEMSRVYRRISRFSV